MRKLLIAVAILLIGSPLYAIEFSWGNAKLVNHYSMSGATNYDSGLNRGLTFFADYSKQIDSISSLGLDTGTFTASRGASNPATWIDSNGVIQVTTTSNQPRLTKGFYNTTGFVSRPGIIVEAAGKNLIIRTDGTASAAGLWTGWSISETTASASTRSQVAVPELSSIASSYSQRIQYTSGGDVNKAIQFRSSTTDAGTIVQNNVVTFSVWLRSTSGISATIGSVKIIINSRDAASVLLNSYSSTDIRSSITSEWKRFTFSTSIIDATASRANFDVDAFGIDTGESYDIEVYAPQAEVNPYATSWIPTTTAALTRNAEILGYYNSGNRTKNEESIFIKAILPYAVVGTGGQTFGYNRFLSSDTKDRHIQISQDLGFVFRPNDTDSNTCSDSRGNASIHTSFVLAAICKHSSPYASHYVDNTIATSETADDYINPEWGSSFYPGYGNFASSQCDGIIQKVAIFNRALSSSEVASVTNELNR